MIGNAYLIISQDPPAFIQLFFFIQLKYTSLRNALSDKDIYIYIYIYIYIEYIFFLPS